MKKILLTLWLIACIFSFSACQKAPVEEPIDEYMQRLLEGSTVEFFTDNFVNLSENEIADYFLRKEDEEFELTEANLLYYNAMVTWEDIKGELGEYQETKTITTVRNKEAGGYTVKAVMVFEQSDLLFSMSFNEEVTAFTGFEFESDYSASQNMNGTILNAAALSVSERTIAFAAEIEAQMEVELNESLGAKMERAALNTLLGMGTVFLVLIFMIFVISCFKYISVIEQKFLKKQEQPKLEAVPAPPVKTVMEEVAIEDVTDDLELVAVITAAIAAATDVPADGLVVRSIRRKETNKWKRA